MSSNNQKIKTRSLEEYNFVMKIRKDKKAHGIIKISKITGIPKDTIRDWIYRGVKPKRLRKTKILPTKSKKLSPELAYILGVIEGDGYLGKVKRHSLNGENYDYILVLSVTDKDFRDYFILQLENWSGFGVYKSKNPQLGKGTKDVYRARLRSKDMYEFLKSYDINKLKESSDEIKAMFLKGFFDSEGHVTRKQKNGQITVGVVNYSIIHLVRALLESLEIKIGSLNEKALIDKKYYYFSIASIESLQKFRDKIGFSIKRKQDRLINILNNSTSYNEIIRKKEQYQNNKNKVYSIISKNQGICIYEISKKLGWSTSKVNNYIKSLMKENIIYKSPLVRDCRNKKLIFLKKL